MFRHQNCPVPESGICVHPVLDGSIYPWTHIRETSAKYFRSHLGCKTSVRGCCCRITTKPSNPWLIPRFHPGRAVGMLTKASLQHCFICKLNWHSRPAVHGWSWFLVRDPINANGMRDNWIESTAAREGVIKRRNCWRRTDSMKTRSV